MRKRSRRPERGTIQGVNLRRIVIGQNGRGYKNASSDDFVDIRGGKDVSVHRNKIDVVEGTRFRWGNHRARPRKTAAGYRVEFFIG